jgi:prevent-host-death family protein
MNSAEIAAGRILVVDNEDSFRTDLVRSLNQRGFYVQGEPDGTRALERLSREPFDVLLSVFDLPGMDGSTMVRRVREARPELAVILMTEKTTNETSIDADELGAQFCLTKPFKLAVIVRALSSVIRRRVPRREIKTRAVRSFATMWVETVASTSAKNDFSRVLELAVHNGPVRITKHQKPRAVLVSIEEYEELLRSRRSPLDELSSEFDALLSQMQKPEAVTAMDGLFDASSDDLGQAAVEGADGRD